MIGWYMQLKLKSKLLFFLIFSSAASLLFSAILYRGVWQLIARNEIENMSQEVLLTLESNLLDNLNMIGNYSKLIISDEDIQEFLVKEYDYESNMPAAQRVQNKLADYVGVDSKISSIYIFAMNGSILSVDTVRNKTAKYTLQNMPWYEEVLALSGSYYVEMDAGSTFELKEDTPCISFIRLINDLSEFQPVGVMVINITQDYLLEAINHLEASNYDVVMYSKDGKCVFSSLKKEGTNLLEALPFKLEGKTSSFFNYDSDQYYASRLRDEKNGWDLVILCRTTAVERGFHMYLLLLFVMLLLVLGVVMILEMRVITEAITNPIHMLLDRMKKVEQGKFEESPVLLAKDEMSELAVGYNTMIQKMVKLFSNLEEEQKEKYKAELLVLQAQIKPHFLYNSLETAKALLSSGNTEQAGQVVKALGEYYKRSLNDGKEEITIAQDLSIVKDYIIVQMIRFQGRCVVEYDIDKSVTERKIPKLTLQPLVENCLVHGVLQCKYPCTIRISVFGDEENVYIDIIDDGVGMPLEKVREIMEQVSVSAPGESKKPTGIGIANTVTRLKMYFKTEDVFTVESVPGEGTKFQICIPNRNDESDCDE